MSSFIDIFQSLYLFFGKFQGTLFTENLLNKSFKFEPQKMKQRKEITTKNKKVVTFTIYAIHFIFS